MRLLSRLFTLAILSMMGLAHSAMAQAPLKEGDPAPDLAIPATQVEKVFPDSKEKTINLKDFKGKKNVVVFYFPKALTKG